MRTTSVMLILFATVAQVMVAVRGSLEAAEPTESTFSYTREDSLIVSAAAKKNEFLAYSSLSGRWSRHTAPSDLRVIPVVVGNVCALAYAEGTVTELAAVDRHGNWRTHKLPSPTQDDCDPICIHDIAVYAIEGKLHAFSAATGTWDTLSLPGLPTTPPPGTERTTFWYNAMENGTLFVQTETHVAAFSVNIGRWACTPRQENDE